MLQYRAAITREAQFVYGIRAPVPMLAGQMWQESGGRAGITASDGGMGAYQFMAATAKQVAKQFPELGAPNPYNPLWAIRANVRMNKYNYTKVKGSDDCEKWGAVLKGYNAGLGYVLRAQKKSDDPNKWFGKTEWIAAGQSVHNFEYSRLYPRWIIFKHQKMFIGWGQETCSIKNPPSNLPPPS